MASVVVEFGQTKNILRHPFDWRIAMLNIKPQWRRCFPTIIGTNSWFETGCPKETSAISKPQESAAHHWHVTRPKEANSVAINFDSYANEFDIRWTSFSISFKFL